MHMISENMTSLGGQPHYEALLGEYNILRQRLSSKTEALLILSKELEECRGSRDKWRSVVEELKTGRYTKNKQHIDNKILAHNLCECKEKNKILQIEIKDLKQKLQDAEGDVKVLREQTARQRLGSSGGGGGEDGTAADGGARHFSAHERGRLVEHLESLKMKYALLERDLQSVLDEKEELIVERDAYKHKVERLNHELNFVLKGDDKKVIDIDSILMENRYLQERLKQTQEEKSLYLQTLSKYKSILEKRRNKSSLKLGSHGNGSVIITHKQVEQMLQDTSLSQLPTTQATIADLRSLALALFESLNDKNVALAHQKKTNKILGHRLAELEMKISKLEFPPEWIIPDDQGSRSTCATEKAEREYQHGGDEDHAEDSPLHCTDAGDFSRSTELANDSVSTDELQTKAAKPDLQIGSCESTVKDCNVMTTVNANGGTFRSPPQSPKHWLEPMPAKANPYSLASTGFSQGSDDDLSPELRKLVQEAMEDLDRRLSQTSVTGGEHFP